MKIKYFILTHYDFKSFEMLFTVKDVVRDLKALGFSKDRSSVQKIVTKMVKDKLLKRELDGIKYIYKIAK